MPKLFVAPPGREMTAKESDFMTNLKKRLIEERGVTESSAVKYMQMLFTLNDKQPFKNLAWAKKYDALEEKISSYAKNTQYLFYNALNSALSLFADKPTYRPISNHWKQKVADSKEERSQENPHEKSEAQAANWMEWEQVLKKKSELKSETSSFGSLKTLNPAQYEALLKCVVLCLYTELPPRRNQDYEAMVVVKKMPKDAPTDRNYYVTSSNQFIFNRYKTARTYGQATEDVPEPLAEAIKVYLKFHPLAKSKEPHGFKFLVKQDGTPLNGVNGITRILNKVFGKRVGSSMLRHSYLTSKYGGVLEEMKKDSEAMAHSPAVQRDYVKE
jgi:hypothetical protein